MVLPSASHLIPIPSFNNWLSSLFFLYLFSLDTLLTALVFEKWVCARSYYGCYLCFYHLFTSVSLFIADLKLCTQCSARPLLAGWYVASERCLLPYLLRKIWKSSDINCGPLSPTYWDGTPYLVNRLCNFSMIFVEVVVSIFSISSLLEWASITIKNMQPRKGPAKSTWTRCQGADDHSHRCIAPVLGSASISCQPEQVLAASSISLWIPGHQMYLLGRAFILIPPRCPRWSSSSTCGQSFGVTMTLISCIKQPKRTLISSLRA